MDEQEGAQLQPDTSPDNKKKGPSKPVVLPWHILRENVRRFDAQRKNEVYISEQLLSEPAISIVFGLNLKESLQDQSHTPDIDYLFGHVGKGNYLQISMNVNSLPLEEYKGARHPHTIVLHERADSNGNAFADDGQPNFLMLYYDDEREVPAIKGDETKTFLYNKAAMQSLFQKNFSSTLTSVNSFVLTQDAQDIAPDVLVYQIDGSTGDRKRLSKNVFLDAPSVKRTLSGNITTLRANAALLLDCPPLLDMAYRYQTAQFSLPMNYGYPRQVLNMAVTQNKPNIVQHILSDLASRDDGFKGIDLGYYLFVAAREGHMDMMDLFLAAGADPRKPVASRRKQLPIHAAVTHGMVGAAKKLLELAPETIGTSPDSGDVPLVLAASHGHLAMVNTLLFQKANINAQNNRGDSALMGAVRNGHLRMAQFLVGCGAALEPVDGNGNAPLVVAAGAGKGEMVEYLFLQCDKEQRDCSGQTALFAASKNGHDDIALWLIKKGAVIDAQDNEGETPWRKAVQNGYFRIADALLDAGANPFALDAAGNDVLSKVRRRGEPGGEVYCLRVMREAEARFANDPPEWRRKQQRQNELRRRFS